MSPGSHAPLVLWLLLLAGPVLGEDFRVERASTRLVDQTYVLDAQIQYGFSVTALEALDNGVPLTLVVRAQVRREGAWIWEASLVDKQVLYLIRYQPLSEQYQVVGDGVRRNFVSRDAAITALGEVEDLPLVERSALRSGQSYRVHLKASLDIEALPLPLRPLAYLKPSWQLASEWSLWPLEP